MNISVLPPEPVAGLTLYHLDTTHSIGRVLQQLAQTRDALLLYPTAEAGTPHGDGAAQAASAAAPPLGMAQVVACDVQARTLTLHMSAAVAPLPSQVWAVAHMAGGVRVQYAVQGQWQAYEGGWQLHMPWPAYVQQLQRRRHPRLSVPLGHNYSASFQFGRRRCVLDVDDLSQAGLALRGTRQETAMLFVGRTLAQVQLALADGPVLHATLHVRARRRYHSYLLGEQVLVGCSIEAMPDDDRAQLAAWLAHGMPASTG